MSVVFDKIQADLEQLQRVIEDADAAVRMGKIEPLRGLEQRVTSLCQAVTKLSDEDANQIRPALGALISEFERLALSLQEFRDTHKTKR